MNISEYIDARLFVLIPVLYCVGAAVKKSSIRDWLIPYILGLLGIVMASAYLIASEAPGTALETAGVIFSGITQGILCASASVYAENLIKQAQKRDEDGGEGGSFESNSQIDL